MTSAQQVWLVIAGVYAGLLAATMILGAIAYDLLALRYGWRSFSEETYLLSRAWPMLGVIVAGMLAFAVGVLVGHLFFPQHR